MLATSSMMLDLIKVSWQAERPTCWLAAVWVKGHLAAVWVKGHLAAVVWVKGHLAAVWVKGHLAAVWVKGHLTAVWVKGHLAGFMMCMERAAVLWPLCRRRAVLWYRTKCVMVHAQPCGATLP
jgi:hypothetical protein